MGEAAIKMEFDYSQKSDFLSYLEKSLRDPFVLDLRGCNLLEVIRACAKAKSKLHPNYTDTTSCLINNITLLEEEYHIKLQPVQVTDIFWGYFITFCQNRGLKLSTISTICSQLKSILNWAVKYNVSVSPTFTDIIIPKTINNKIALTSDEVSRITYFDVQRFYKDRRKDFRDTMERVRDMFVLSCNLYQRYSDMIRINSDCFSRNIFKIIQQKTGNLAVVNIDRYAIDAKTTYRILEKYNYEPPYKATIGNYNYKLHQLMRDIGFCDNVRYEERINGKLIVYNKPKYELISSHTARRTAITINVLRGNNIHAIKRCSGHVDLKIFDEYVRDE